MEERELGVGQQWAEARQAASDDMARAVSAGDVISGLIKEVQKFLNPGTWGGPVADGWMAEWNTFHNRLLRMLNELSAAQMAVVNSVDREIAALERRS